MCYHIEVLEILCIVRASGSASAAFTAGVAGVAVAGGAAVGFALYRGRLEAKGSVDALAYGSRLQFTAAVAAALAFAFAGSLWSAGVAAIAAIPPAVNRWGTVPALAKATAGPWPGIGRTLEWLTVAPAAAMILAVT